MQDDDLIIKYIDNELSFFEKKNFEKRLQTEVALAKKLESHKLAMQILDADNRLQLLKELETFCTKKKPKQQNTKGVLGRLLSKLSSSKKKLIDHTFIYSQFQTFHAEIVMRNIPTNQSPKNQTLSKFQQAIHLYNQKAYQKAFDLLLDINKQNSNYITAQFFLGNASMAIHKPAIAIHAFSLVVEHKSSNLYLDAAEWYLALAYLANDDMQKAYPLLQYISKESDDKYYRNLATKTLKKIEEL